MSSSREVTGPAAHTAGAVGRVLLRDPRDSGHSRVVKRYVTPKVAGTPRYLELMSDGYLRPGHPPRRRFARRIVKDAAGVTDAELAALLDYEWRSRFTAAWLIGVDRRASFRERLGELLLASEVCYAGAGYCFALARLGTRADAELLAAYLDRYLPRTECRYDQPEALGSLLRVDAALGTSYADRFVTPGGLWQGWVEAEAHLRDDPAFTPEAQRRRADLRCDFAGGWTRP
ncbi:MULTISPECIES: DUF6000 family protein [Streptomyces]|uniref:Uncharacterized protein n=1 Tax=Streptomyces venezuelae TaxID=54571 RepID=A0A5P2AR47_STRVZ|nr:DUF6000 family protein [Streptomyces venezuelae]QES20028.1 hypothetical protein DEJ46_13670 [Streptomyces venezuelae]